MLLALDTSTSLAGVALHDGSRVYYEETWLAGRHHSEQVLARVAIALDSVGLAMRDLNALAVARGPGSFTGVRVGLALAKGLALGAHLPLYGVGTLDAFADAFTWADVPVRVFVEAGRGRWASGRYEPGPHGARALSPPANLGLDDVLALDERPAVFAGELDDAARGAISTRFGESI